MGRPAIWTWDAGDLTALSVLVIVIGIGTWLGWPMFPIALLAGAALIGGIIGMFFGIHKFWTWYLNRPLKGD